MRRVAALSAFVILAIASASPCLAQASADEQAAVIQFQRSLDSYAFQHRQVQRRLGEPGDARVMSDAMRRARPAAADGDFFSPLVSDVLRRRIDRAIRDGCALPATPSTTFEVHRVGSDAAGSGGVPACLLNVLPRLPAELEYRASGVVLLLVDTHAGLVVDVLHGAFPATR